MRDPAKLQAFQLVDQLALSVYRATKTFPRQEQFGLTAQIRRAAVSAASNIVEGSARNSLADYLHFLDMAYGSACELQYQLSLAFRLGFLADADHQVLSTSSEQACKVLNALIRSLRR